MWLPWEIAMWAAVGFGVVWLAVRRWGRLAPVWVQLAKELSLLFLIYAVWHHAGDFSIMGTEGAMRRGKQVWDVERWLHLPNEVTLQRWVLKSELLVRFANLYYIVFHVAPLGIFLAWLFIRHRDQFGRWRNHLAFSSLVCLAIQYVPVAPPRMFPELGFVDTGALYGPRVYDAAGSASAGQLAAMPSMHVAWAMLIGVATWSVTRSRWRWLGPAHAFFTVYAVTVTSYHWLADGIVATAVLFAGIGLAALWQRAIASRREGAPADVSAGDAALEPAREPAHEPAQQPAWSLDAGGAEVASN